MPNRSSTALLDSTKIGGALLKAIGMTVGGLIVFAIQIPVLSILLGLGLICRGWMDFFDKVKTANAAKAEINQRLAKWQVMSNRFKVSDGHIVLPDNK